jgi:hypothetical protein
MAKLTIDWCEKAQTSTGKDYMKVTIAGETMNCFPWKFAEYAKIMPGAIVDGKVLVDGKFKNLVDDVDAGSEGVVVNAVKKPAFGGGGVKAMVQEKNTNIKLSQENKERGIILSSTARDASLFVTTFYADKGWSEEELKEKWLAWRGWFAKNWGEDVSDITEPF